MESIAGTMTTPEGFEMGVRQMNQLNPGLLKQAGFMAAPDGSIPYTPENERLARFMHERSLSAVDRQSIASKSASVLDKEADNRRAEEKEKRRQFETDREYAQRQADIELRRKDREQAREEKDSAVNIKRSDRLVKQATDELVKTSPVYKAFDNYKRAKATSDALKADLMQEGGYGNVTGPAAQALFDSYRNMATEYRSRTGGAYDQKIASSFDGMFQKIDRFVSTIGKESPIVTRNSAVSLIKEIDRQYQDVNEMVVQSELKQIEKLNSQKVDLNMFVPKGDYASFAQKTGAKIVPSKDGSQRMLVYKGKGYFLPQGAE